MLKRFRDKKKNNKGFTLVELVVVVAILAILVGLLAPQYTKYVERSRKSADASNLDEMVKAVEIYAADPEAELAAGKYIIYMDKDGTVVSSAIVAAVEQTAPDYASKKLKSKKWADDGSLSAIAAEITVDSDGGTSVKYAPEKLGEFVDASAAATLTEVPEKPTKTP